MPEGNPTFVIPSGGGGGQIGGGTGSGTAGPGQVGGGGTTPEPAPGVKSPPTARPQGPNTPQPPATGGGGGTPPQWPPWPNIELPKITPPSWWHGYKPPVNLAATVRDAWFAFLGSLSGFPYSPGLLTLSSEVVVMVTDGNGNGLAGAVVTVTISDPNTGAQIASEEGNTNASGVLTLAFGSLSGAAGGSVNVQWYATYQSQSAQSGMIIPFSSLSNFTVPTIIFTGTSSGPGPHLPGGHGPP